VRSRAASPPGMANSRTVTSGTVFEIFIPDDPDLVSSASQVTA
jgi:hypothetical protein